MAGSFSLIPLSLFIYGIVTYMPFHMTLSQIPGQLNQYSIRLTNKTPYPHLYRIRETGLPVRSASWQSKTVRVPGGGQVVLPFEVENGARILGTGVHPFSITVRSLNGKPGKVSQDATYFLPAS
jgi:hypothetical protein